MLTCPYCQTENSSQVAQCVTCGSSLGSDVLPNGTLLFGNTLEIQSVLGRGGFGIVYKALHLEKQRFVAIKELFPEGLATRGYNKQVSTSSPSEMQAAIDRTNREAQMLRKLKHPSATKLFAYWEENSTAYMALELLESETLEKRIQNGQLLNAEEAKNALLTILEVLEELHGHGFLHRDIKPANIMFTPSKVELIDFGSLTEFRKGERTKVTSRIATPEYAPLEQFGSEVMLSPATDLYALAATFCEAMTGSRVPSALDRANGASIEPNILAVQRVSRELADVFEKALEAQINLRYLTAEAMRFDLMSMTGNQKVIIQTSAQLNKRYNWFWILTRAVPIAIALSLLAVQSILPNGFVRRTVDYMLAPTLDEFLANDTFIYSDKSNEPNFIDSFQFSTQGKNFFAIIDSAMVHENNLLAVNFLIYPKGEKFFYLTNFYDINTKRRIKSIKIESFIKNSSTHRLESQFIYRKNNANFFHYNENVIYKYNFFGDLSDKFTSDFLILNDIYIGNSFISFSTFEKYNFIKKDLIILDKNTFKIIFKKEYNEKNLLNYVFNDEYLVLFSYNNTQSFCTKEKYLTYDFSKLALEKSNSCSLTHEKLNDNVFYNFVPYSPGTSVTSYDISKLGENGDLELINNIKLFEPIKSFNYESNIVYYNKNNKLFSFDLDSNSEQEIFPKDCSSGRCFIQKDSILYSSQDKIVRYKIKTNP